MSAFGADVAAVVSQLSLQGCILAGHSMGGHIILEAARLLRGQVAGLIWVDSYSRLPESRTIEQVRERLAPFRANFNDAAHAFFRGMLPTTADPSLVERLHSQIGATREASHLAL
jgi:pimeloyl-ACP methyl ester carboxylesterase